MPISVRSPRGNKWSTTPSCQARWKRAPRFSRGFGGARPPRTNVSKARKRSIGLVAGCCLVLACSGCRFGEHWRAAEWRYQIAHALDTAERAECPAAPSPTGCPTDGDCGSTCVPLPVDACGPMLCGCGLPGCLSCAGPNAAVGVAYYRHPHFHPVPLRPVFSPRSAEMAPPDVPQPKPRDRLTSVPRRLPTHSDSRSWIFLPATRPRQNLTAGTRQPIRR